VCTYLKVVVQIQLTQFWSEITKKKKKSDLEIMCELVLNDHDTLMKQPASLVLKRLSADIDPFS